MHSEFWAQFLIALAEIYIFCFFVLLKFKLHVEVEVVCWSWSYMLKLKLKLHVEVACWSWSCMLKLKLKLKLHVEVEVPYWSWSYMLKLNLNLTADIIHMHAQIPSFCSWLKFLLLWLTSYISMLKLHLFVPDSNSCFYDWHHTHPCSNSCFWHLPFGPEPKGHRWNSALRAGPAPWSMLCMCTHAHTGAARPGAHAHTRPLTPQVPILTTPGTYPNWSIKHELCTQKGCLKFKFSRFYFVVLKYTKMLYWK